MIYNKVVQKIIVGKVSTPKAINHSTDQYRPRELINIMSSVKPNSKRGKKMVVSTRTILTTGGARTHSNPERMENIFSKAV